MDTPPSPAPTHAPEPVTGPIGNPQRASDADRDDTATRLRDAVGEGRLTLAEADERIAAAYAAVHHHDLAVLTADLPSPPAPDPGIVRRRPPVRHVVLLVLVVAWIASPLPFPWPLLLVAFLVHRAVRARRERHVDPHPSSRAT